MNDLQFYLESAEKAIRCWGNSKMLLDEDCISYVAYHMMVADSKFDGRGSQYGYRGRCAKFAVMSLKSDYVNRKRMLSLDAIYNDQKMLDFIGKEDVNYGDVDEILENKGLTEKESSFLKMYYVDEMSMPDIGKENNVSKQYVHQIIEKGLKKLRKYYNAI